MLADLHDEMRRVSAIDPSTVGIGFGKRIGDGTNIAVDRMEQVQVHDQMQVKREEVLRAQKKVDEGTYGSCDGCGRPIGDERLEHLPSATHCIACAGAHKARRR
jgi:DnaK suppressor protein